ncbi:TrmH family RNA methyltransferase [bacterium]|nr:TrmH family RNA methyltransferase [bacterium]
MTDLPTWDRLDQPTKEALTDYLRGFITDHKWNLMDEKLEDRTRHVTLILEDVYQPHNASAVIRTSDCFGLSDIHIIENSNKYTTSPGVSMGANKWVRVNKWGKMHHFSTPDCIAHLKREGYRIVASTPHTDEILLHDLPIDAPMAIMIGTEEEGLSDEALELAEEFVRIPMVGFTESFNLSVTAGIVLYDIMTRLWASGVSWKLTDEERFELRDHWIGKVLRRRKQLESRFWDERG